MIRYKESNTFRRNRYMFNIIFGIASTIILTSFITIGYVLYSFASDPMGTANFVGNVAAELAGPVIEAIKE
jgi:hypothetical protein